MSADEPNARSRWGSRMDRGIERLLGLSRPTIAEMSQVWSPGKAGGYCPRCGQGSGPGEQTASGCGACRKSGAVLDGVIALGPFAGQLAEGIRALKYHARGELAHPLGRHLARAVRGRFPRGLDSRRWTVVPMPMPFWRKIDRRVDHARLIALCMASSLGLGHVQPLKKAAGVPQAGRSRTDREKASRREFGIRRGRHRGGDWPYSELRGRSVLLVDDVLTTGRSMRLAGGLLGHLGAISVHAAVLAVSANRSLGQVER